MKPIKSLPEIIEREIENLRRDVIILEDRGFNHSIFHNELRTKIGTILYAIDKRDQQVREALNWFEYYSNNRNHFIRDYPETYEEVKKMSVDWYRSYVLRKAFEGIKYN